MLAVFGVIGMCLSVTGELVTGIVGIVNKIKGKK